MSKRKKSKSQNKKSKNPFANVSFYAHQLTHALPKAERMQHISTAAKTAEEKFAADLNTVHAEIVKTNPLQLLCSLSMYFLHSFNPAPDEWKQHNKLFQHHIEVIQALALKHQWSEFGMERTDPQKLIDTIKEVSQLFIFKRAQAVGPSMSEQDEKVFLSRESMRTHTQAVRNWGYPQHMHSILHKLMRNLDEICLQERGIKASECVDLLFNLIELSEFRMNRFLEEKISCTSKPTKQEMLESYRAGFPYCQWLKHSQALVDDTSVSLKQFREHLLVCSDFSLPFSVFLVHTDDIQRMLGDGVSEETVRSLLKHWSFGFGEISLPDEHLFMGNPVRHRPFIKTMDDFYVLPIPGLLLSFCQQLLESLFQSPESKRAYEKARAKFLEDELCEILCSSFPRGKLSRNSEWKSDIDQKTYENDAIMIIDQVAFVCEAKSGRVAESARRGGDRLDTEIKELLLEPAEQAIRFADYLSRHPGLHEFKTRGGEANNIDTTNVREFIPITVTLDDLNLRWDADAYINTADDATKKAKACAFLLSDFLVAMDLLNSETVRVHYLQRLHSFNHRDKFIGDEIDLLAIYMKTRLQSNLPQDTIYLGAGEAHPIDEYYLKTYEGIECSKPEFPVNERWCGIVSRFDAMGDNSGWTTLAKPLLDVSFKEQNKIESHLKKLAAKVRSGKERVMTLTFKNGSEASNASIIFVVHPQPDADLRKTVLSAFESAFDSSERDLAIGVGINAFDLKHPYSVLTALSSSPLTITT